MARLSCFNDSKESFQSKFELHKRVVKERTGKDLVIFSEENLSLEQIVQYKQLKPFLDIQRVPEVDAQVIDLLKNKRLTLREIQALVVELGVLPQYAMALIAQDLLKTVDLTIVKRDSLVELSA